MAGSESGSKVLAVDDDPVVLKLLVTILAQAGFDPVGATNAEGALASLEGGAISILITDLQMPGRSGIELIEDVRARGVRVPVIILSGALDDEARRDAARLGNIECLSKPLDRQQLLESISRLLSKGDP
jgi:two-component system response regulator FixJ